ncbi:MAG: hypothetical protein G01um10143_177 [Parcubacteria group bacterium Gr01-1014_3]|nr:MAG: hypothetical protein G01um10143_177 [Parcubacteria group bacterium Gr01-1014_3]
MKLVKFNIFLVASAILVGLLYIAPPLIVKYHLQKDGRVFALNYEVYRDELFYLSRAREIYDGHFPPSDLHFDEQRPTVQNPIPSLILAGMIALTGGNIHTSYLIAQFVFTPIIFLLFYWLGTLLFKESHWAILFAFVGVLTPIAMRILNFNGA